MKVTSSILLQNASEDVACFISHAPERTWRQFAATALISNLTKKFVGSDADLQLADKAALDKFLEVNTSLLGSPRRAETMLDQYLLGELKNSLERFWYRNGEPLVMGLNDLYYKGRMGPGSSLQVKGNTFYTKMFASRFTTTSELLYKSYRAATQSNPLSDDAEKFRSETWGDCDVVTASKLLFVPKSTAISRTICVEPSLNMFYQLGLGRIIEDRLREVYHIDLSSQPDFNRELARLGSVGGKYSTIDLSSASDSLSTGVLKEILPKSFFGWLSSLRVPRTVLPDGRVVDLRMISTMGNGFTFPLETVIFASIVAACHRVNGSELLRNEDGKVGNFAVFGDDIIIEENITSKVMRLLWLLGFTPNLAKTFVIGPFRESCGSDWFEGHNVRSVYIKSLETPQDRYVAINLLNDWSASSGILLPRTLACLLASVKGIYVPPYVGLDAGIHVSSHLNPVKPKVDRNGSLKFRQYLPRPYRVKVAEDGHSKLDVGREPNKTGLELTFIAGYIRSGYIGLRQRSVRYQMKTSVTPNWDSMDVNRSRGLFSFKRWEAAVFGNLTNS